jgi:hypothetical protein
MGHMRVSTRSRFVARLPKSAALRSRFFWVKNRGDTGEVREKRADSPDERGPPVGHLQCVRRHDPARGR